MTVEAQVPGAIPIPVVTKDTPTSDLTKQGASPQDVWAAALAAATRDGGAIVYVKDVSAPVEERGVVVTPLPEG